MRLFLLAALLSLLGACARTDTAHPPPPDRFYFPSGLAFAPQPGSVNGVLYVASTNYDRRFDWSSLSAVQLDNVRSADGRPLPPLGQPVPPTGPVQLTNLGPLGPSAFVFLASFTGRIAQMSLPDGGTRLFIPSQSEGNPLQIVEAQGDQLTCLFVDPSSPNNCANRAPSLTANANNPASPGVLAAPQPYDVTITPDNIAYVTHVYSADSPPGTQTNLSAYLVRLDALNPPSYIAPTSDHFLLIGDVGTWDVAAGRRYEYLSGVYPQPTTVAAEDVLVRLVDYQGGIYVNESLREQFQALEARGLLLSPDESRLYLITRTPDTLLVLNIVGSTSDTPSLFLERAVPLPAGPLEMRMVPRTGGGDLLAITCETANALVFYDNDLGDLSGQVPGIGLQPSDLVVDLRPGNQARIYVSDEGDGRVAVVDVPDLLNTTTARLVAHIGEQQTCLVQPTDPSCTGAQP